MDFSYIQRQNESISFHGNYASVIPSSTGNSSSKVSPKRRTLTSTSNKKKSKIDTDEEDKDVPTISTKGGVKAPFPVKLMDLLNLIAKQEPQLESIISWQPSGESFKVRDKNRFVKEVQSNYFTQTNYTSFRRQLNLWGFKRIEDKSSEDYGCYFNPMFKRNDKYGCRLMRRPGKNSSQTMSQAKTKIESAKNARRVSLYSQKEEGTVFHIFLEDITPALLLPLGSVTALPSMNMNYSHSSPVDVSTNQLSLFPTSRSNYYTCHRFQDRDLNFIVDDDSTNPIVVQEDDEFEPIVDEKDCVLPRETVIFLLDHALKHSDSF